MAKCKALTGLAVKGLTLIRTNNHVPTVWKYITTERHTQHNQTLADQLSACVTKHKTVQLNNISFITSNVTGRHRGPKRKL